MYRAPRIIKRVIPCEWASYERLVDAASEKLCQRETFIDYRTDRSKDEVDGRLQFWIPQWRGVYQVGWDEVMHKVGFQLADFEVALWEENSRHYGGPFGRLFRPEFRRPVSWRSVSAMMLLGSAVPALLMARRCPKVISSCEQHRGSRRPPCAHLVASKKAISALFGYSGCWVAAESSIHSHAQNAKGEAGGCPGKIPYSEVSSTAGPLGSG